MLEMQRRPADRAGRLLDPRAAAEGDELARTGDEREVDTALAQPPVRRVQVSHHLGGDADLLHRIAITERPLEDGFAREWLSVIVLQ